MSELTISKPGATLLPSTIEVLTMTCPAFRDPEVGHFRPRENRLSCPKCGCSRCVEGGSGARCNSCRCLFNPVSGEVI